MGLFMDIKIFLVVLAFTVPFIILISFMRKKLLYAGECYAYLNTYASNVKTTDKNSNDYSYHYEAELEGMKCENCAKSVEETLNSHDGIYAKADLNTKKIIIHSKRELGEIEVLDYLIDLPYTLVDFKKIKDFGQKSAS